MNRPVQWASVRGRPVQWASASGRPVQWASVRGRPAQWASASGRPVQWASVRGRPAQWASARSRSPQRESSSIVQAQEASRRSWVASSREKYPVTSFSRPVTSFSSNKTLNGAGSRGQPSSRSWSPHGVSSRSRSPHGTSSRSRPADRGRSPLTSSSSNKTHNGAGSRGQPRKRSPSPQGAISRSPSPQAATNKSGNQISIPVNIDQNSEDEDGVSATSTGADADPKALSSPEPPDGLYGVKVSNFHFQLKSKHIKSCLTEHFMPYGNVVCVTMHGTFKDRYGLVFYKQKWEREKALKADTNGPLEKELCITRWSGPSPCIFGIVVTDINDTSLDVPDRIRSEFSIFGDIALVMMRGLLLERFVVVFYKDRKSQEKALATKNPFKTSFGEVTLHAWNRPPPPQSEMSNDDILMAVGYSDVAMLESQ